MFTKMKTIEFPVAFEAPGSYVSIPMIEAHPGMVVYQSADRKIIWTEEEGWSRVLEPSTYVGPTREWRIATWNGAPAEPEMVEGRIKGYGAPYIWLEAVYE